MGAVFSGIRAAQLLPISANRAIPMVGEWIQISYAQEKQKVRGVVYSKQDSECPILMEDGCGIRQEENRLCGISISGPFQLLFHSV